MPQQPVEPAEGLTVAVCAFNSEHRVNRFVRPLLESLADEAFATELLLVDDGSTDATAAIAAQLEPGIRLVRHNRNRGLPAARNTALLNAAHDWILFCDDDLAVSSGTVRALWAAREISVCFVPEVRSPDGRLENAITTFTRWGEPRFHHHADPVAGGLAYAMGACFLVHRRTALAVGGFDERLRLYFEDADFGLQLHQHQHSVRMLPGVRVTHHAHGAAPERGQQQELENQVQRARWTFLWLRPHGGHLALMVLAGACRVTLRSVLAGDLHPLRGFVGALRNLRLLRGSRALFDVRSRTSTSFGERT